MTQYRGQRIHPHSHVGLSGTLPEHTHLPDSAPGNNGDCHWHHPLTNRTLSPASRALAAPPDTHHRLIIGSSHSPWFLPFPCPAPLRISLLSQLLTRNFSPPESAQVFMNLRGKFQTRKLWGPRSPQEQI